VDAAAPELFWSEKEGGVSGDVLLDVGLDSELGEFAAWATKDEFVLALRSGRRLGKVEVADGSSRRDDGGLLRRVDDLCFEQGRRLRELTRRFSLV